MTASETVLLTIGVFAVYKLLRWEIEKRWMK